MKMERRHEPEKQGRGRMKRGLIIGLAVLGVLVLVATLVVTDVIRMGTVTLHLDRETYRPRQTATMTFRNLSTGVVVHGYFFEVQRFEDGDWVRVPFDQGPVPSIGLGLRPGQSFEQDLSLRQGFVETPEPGRYRVVKEFRVRPALDGAFRAIHGTEHTLVAEFNIEV